MKKYREAELEVIEFDTEDVIVTSCTANLPQPPPYEPGGCGIEF